MTRTTDSAITKHAAKANRVKPPQIDLTNQLAVQLRELRLPTIRDHFQEAATQATTENLNHLEYLSEL